MQRRRVRSGEVSVAVREYDGPPAPTLIAVHGYPDSQQMWEPLAAHLDSRLRLVTYDVRGAGESTAPSSRAGYRTERLVDDLVAVMDAVAPDQPVHLLGHDWGSLQLWDAVTAENVDPRLTGRIATYTSISGPSLDHIAAAMPGASWQSRLAQARHSWYIYAFQLPVVPELIWRGLHGPIGRRLARAEGLDPAAGWGPGLARDGANGVQLYRANMLRRLRSPRRPATTQVPVQLVVPRHDPFVTPSLLRRVDEYVEELRRVEVDCGHWLPRSHPAELAELVTEWVLRR